MDFYLSWLGRGTVRVAGLRGVGTRAASRRVFALIRLEYPDCAEGLRTNGTTGNNESPPCFSSSDSSSTESSQCSVALGGVSACQLAAASPTPATTSWIAGLLLMSPSQHFWMSFHKTSEIPIFSAFSGLSGRTPNETWYASSKGLISRNGCSPVRT